MEEYCVGDSKTSAQAFCSFKDRNNLKGFPGLGTFVRANVT
jgi:hypothetical protein